MKRKPETYKQASRYNLVRNRMTDESMPGVTRYVWFVLDSYNDKQGLPLARPPLCKILKRLGMGRTAFYQHRALLIERHWIEATERIGADGKQMSTEYRTIHDWKGIANQTVSRVPDSGSTPVRLTAPLDMTCTSYFVEEADESNQTKEDPALYVLPNPPKKAAQA